MKTTFEMDGLFTQEDIDNRYKLMTQCATCGEYSKWDTEPVVDATTLKETKRPFNCSYCGSESYVYNSGVSIRTYNPLTHNKRKKRK